MNKYEAMFIFADDLKDEALEEALNKVRAEIKKVGGEVASTTRMGRRAFARPLHKKESGQYVLIVFSCGGEHITPLLAKYHLNEEVFRVTIMRAGATPPPAEKPVETK
ncbi:MAG: 30S ribosomal protein S6 [Verrucomicrobia bacterium]|nr:MAG: 30S ribosomal protein S6 [Verrucomicrobiota bacterium]